MKPKSTLGFLRTEARDNHQTNSTGMNKLIPGARFSARAAREQRLRAQRQPDAVTFPQGATDVRQSQTIWSRAAEALHREDPDGRKLAELLNDAEE
jgi:hypothetical protein